MSQLAVSSVVSYFALTSTVPQVIFTESRRVDGIYLKADGVSSVTQLLDNDGNVYGYMSAHADGQINTSWIAGNGLTINSNRTSQVTVVHSAEGV